MSIPVTLAVVFSVAGGSDLLTLGGTHSRAPAAVARGGAALSPCRATRGYYALTFEDGPFPATTPRLVTALRRVGAAATFFDVGSRAAARLDLVTLQDTVGQVANHTYTHAALAGLSRDRRIHELQATAAILGYPNRLFRSPDEWSSPALDADVRASGLVAVDWTVDTDDRVSRVGQVVRRALWVRPGGILRLHEGSETATVAVPRIVAALRRRGMCPGVISASARAVRRAKGHALTAKVVKP